MGFTIPNAPSASIVDQAEPDSVDFSALGDRTSGVVAGCEVSAPGGSQTVSVAVGEVISLGAFKTVGSTTLSMGLSESSSSRFDLVVVDSSGTVAKRQGVASSNPTFPALNSGDVLLAAVYRRNSSGTGTSIESSDIIDKRIFTASSLVRTGAGTPSNSLGNVGDVYINTTTSSTSGQSQVWIKTAASLWENLGEYTVPQVSTNTSNTLVLRDASGNFSAGTITANLIGNATSVSNGVYDNSGTYGISITGNAATATYAPNAGNSASCSGNSVTATTATSAETATRLNASRTISLSGHVAGSVSTDLSSNATISNTTIQSGVIKTGMFDYQTDVVSGGVPKISVSNGAPSGGKNGDVWITVV